MGGTANAAVVLQLANVAGTTDNINASTAVANEASLATSASRTGVVGFRVTTAGIIPPGQNVFIRLTLTGGTFPTALTGAEVVKGATGAVVAQDGTAGNTTVRYLITTDSGATTDAVAPASSPALPAGQTDSIEFAIPVFLGATCGTGINITVSEFQTEVAQTPIENGNVAATFSGTSAGSGVPIRCVNAISPTLVPDSAATSLDFDTALGTKPAFSDFIVAGPDAANTAVLGTFGLSINSTAVTSLTTLATIVPTDVTGFTVTANFASAANPAIESCQGVGTSGTFFGSTVAATGPTSCTIVGVAAAASFATEAGTFNVSLDSAAPIAGAVAQVVSVSAATVNLNTAAGLVATDPFNANALGVGPDVEDLVYAGQTFGPYDWVGDSTLATNNVFRVTGLSSTSAIQGAVVISNASGGTSFNRSYPFATLSATVPVVNGEAIINATRITQIVGGNFGRADVTLVFSSSSDLDVDRLMSSAAGSAVVSSYGDNANSSGVGGSAPLTTTTSRDDVSNN